MKKSQTGKKIFLSTPSARRATDVYLAMAETGAISIHALREEGDQVFILELARAPLISIHALREEGDKSRPRNRPLHLNFYPRPPRGGRHREVCYGV